MIRLFGKKIESNKSRILREAIWQLRRYQLGVADREVTFEIIWDYIKKIGGLGVIPELIYQMRMDASRTRDKQLKMQYDYSEVSK